MEIVDVGPGTEELFWCCLKPYDGEFAGGVPARRDWCRRLGGGDLGAKLTVDDDGQVAGMVQYVPVEHVPHVVGQEGVWVVLCI